MNQDQQEELSMATSRSYIYFPPPGIPLGIMISIITSQNILIKVINKLRERGDKLIAL